MMKQEGVFLMFPDDVQINLIKTFLVQALDPFLIMLFGSAAAGQLRKDSDFDIAFLSDREMGSYQLFTLSQQLADLLGREVHLIDLNTTSTVLQAQVVVKGKSFLTKNRIDARSFSFLF